MTFDGVTNAMKPFDTVLTWIPFFPKNHSDNRVTSELAQETYAQDRGKYRPCVVLGQDAKFEQDLVLAQIRSDVDSDWPPRHQIDWKAAGLLHDSAILTSTYDLIRIPKDRIDQIHVIGHLAPEDIKSYQAAFYQENKKHHSPDAKPKPKTPSILKHEQDLEFGT